MANRGNLRALSLATVWVVASVVCSEAVAVAADADNGSRLARRWCAPCHVVAPNQAGVTGEAPPFASIARRPDFDAPKLALFLLDPHPKMPAMGLSRTEAADLAAYIGALQR
jgi:mono/diheme cytochrome c family protein